ncbi:AraC family transcriptional regulator [Olivibacter sp. SDN3]|uniref:AraC family transcriptional regulator n=1 Tax=Olivibacter sp. SDN3 TaxID=2764720 RepID=UPI00165173B6|nr:AraC family transcriptional regulator [Olivibacter sp. SDN3]QNL50479.1 AraC family transcriptional regulator [Olivibacter sp. SDN3]
MQTFQKYLPIQPSDQKWGLYALSVGFGQINAAHNYPSPNHPSTYRFEWDKGRVLREYQLIYITRGEGVFESTKSGIQRVYPGSIIILFPNEWHRYKPDEATGWAEYWVGFNGPVADQLIKNNFFTPYNPVINLGFKDEVIDLYDHITEQSRQERPYYQQLVSGDILQLLGNIYALSREKQLDGDDSYIHDLINQSKLVLRENFEQLISIEDIAEQLGVSYSLFRKAFKKHVGISPGQYLIQLKIEKAKFLLNHPHKRIKDIAYELGFDSCFYFSKLFKDKTGLSPEHYRRNKMTGGIKI